jgi:hypothetical protein
MNRLFAAASAIATSAVAGAVLLLAACGGATDPGTTGSGGTGTTGTGTTGTGTTGTGITGGDTRGSGGTGTGSTIVTGTGATTVSGRFLVEGGPLGAGERPIRGTVTFTGGGGRRVSVLVGRSGTFAVALVPGIYHVSGRSPNIVEVDADGTQHETTCSQPLTVHLNGQRTLKITLTCIVP